MGDWKSLLKDDSTGWLLERTNPSVRYFTLRWLLDLPKSDPTVSEAEQAIKQSKPVQKLLARQRPQGYWGNDQRPHQGVKSHLKLLMWLGYRGNGDVKQAIETLIDGCLLEDGAYAIELRERLVRLPCHSADLLRMMLWSGYQQDPRTKRLLDWLVAGQGEDGIWPCGTKRRPYSCLWGTVDVLRAYRDLPEDWVKAEVENSRRLAMEQILNSNLYQYGKAKPNPRWFLFGFPLRFDTDILETLEILAPYVSPDEERIQAGLKLVLEKQNPQGRWLCEKYPKGGMWMMQYVASEEIGQPSKWVTLHAMRMLKDLNNP